MKHWDFFCMHSHLLLHLAIDPRRRCSPGPSHSIRRRRPRSLPAVSFLISATYFFPPPARPLDGWMWRFYDRGWKIKSPCDGFCRSLTISSQKKVPREINKKADKAHDTWTANLTDGQQWWSLHWNAIIEHQEKRNMSNFFFTRLAWIFI